MRIAKIGLMMTVTMAIILISGCDPKPPHWRLKCGTNWYFVVVPGPVIDRVIGGIVFDQTHQVSEVNASRENGVPIPIDSSVSATHQALLSAEFQAQGLFDPTTQQVAFFRTTNIEILAATDSVNFGFKLLDGLGVPVPTGTLYALGATSETDLSDGTPLSGFVSQLDSAIAIMPTTTASTPLGGAVISAGVFHLQLRNSDGLSVLNTTIAVPVTPGNSSSTVSTAIATAWLDPDITITALSNKLLIEDHLARNFRCYISDDGVTWMEITFSSPPVLNGITFGSATSPHAIPTLSEWGLIFSLVLLTLMGTSWISRNGSAIQGRR